VRQAILEATPEAPDQINRKVHPVLSELIMKSLSKNPEERYASGQELVLDLERSKIVRRRRLPKRQRSDGHASRQRIYKYSPPGNLRLLQFYRLPKTDAGGKTSACGGNALQKIVAKAEPSQGCFARKDCREESSANPGAESSSRSGFQV